LQELLRELLETFAERPHIKTALVKWTRMAEIIAKKSLKQGLPESVLEGKKAARDYVQSSLLAMNEDATLDYVEFFYRYSPYIFDLDEDSFSIEMGWFAGALNRLFIENDFPYRFIAGEILPV
jgi:hypothetical protein